MEKERVNWVLCPECGHKLFKKIELNDDKPLKAIEIKCHSCKKISVIKI